MGLSFTFSQEVNVDTNSQESIGLDTAKIQSHLQSIDSLPTTVKTHTQIDQNSDSTPSTYHDSVLSRNTNEPLKVVKSKDSSRLDSNFIYEYIAHPILTVVTWPLNKIFIPTFETLLYPIKPPIMYIFDNKVLDKAVEMISFGPDQRVMVYPIAVISTGTGSQTGVVLRMKRPFGYHKSKMVLSYQYYINGDQKYKARMVLKGIFNSIFNVKLSMFQNRIKERTPYKHTEDSRGVYSDTTSAILTTLGTPFLDHWSFNTTLQFELHDFGNPPLEFKTIQRDDYFFNTQDSLLDRGIGEKNQDLTGVLGITRNTVDNDNIPTEGSFMRTAWAYHLVTNKHNFHSIDFKWVKFIHLGVDRYEISPKEQREMGVPNFKKIKEVLKYKNLRKNIFDRKVIATQVRMAESYEIKGHRGPVYMLNSIGNATPLRAFGGSPFKDYAMAAWSLEYRFPIMRLVEGTLFNEFGIVGDHFYSLDIVEDLKHSWGLGIRFARSNIFLFRGYIAMGNGFPRMKLTIDKVY